MEKAEKIRELEEFIADAEEALGDTHHPVRHGETEASIQTARQQVAQLQAG